MITSDQVIAAEASAMAAGLFTSRLAKTPSQTQPVRLSDRIRWEADRIRKLGKVHIPETDLTGRFLIRQDAELLDRHAEDVAQLEAALADTRTLLKERDAKITQLNEIIRKLGGGVQ